MFRIKTDIRQYKCETKEKVEKLIRNWVIRPNDLIFDQDQNSWDPIGDHPEFTDVFALLAESESATPDTVVSQKPQREEEEVTHVSERPSANGTQPPRDDTRATDIFDQDEIARAIQEDVPSTPEIPQAPEGVEPPRHDDEVTMMTDKTFDMLAEEAISEATEDEEPDSEVESSEAEVSEESQPDLSNEESDPTIVEPNVPTEEEQDTPVDAPKLGRHDLPEEFFATNEIVSVNRDEVEKRDDLSSASEASEVDDEWEQMVDDFHGGEDLSEASEAADPTERPSLETDIPPEPKVHEVDDSDEISDSFDDEDSEPLEEDSEPAEHIDGYLIPAPFDVGPTPEDVKLGLRRSKVSAAAKLAAFPDPKQKEYMDPIVRHFDRTPTIPKDYSVLMLFGFLVFFVILLVLISQC